MRAKKENSMAQKPITTTQPKNKVASWRVFRNRALRGYKCDWNGNEAATKTDHDSTAASQSSRRHRIWNRETDLVNARFLKLDFNQWMHSVRKRDKNENIFDVIDEKRKITPSKVWWKFLILYLNLTFRV